MLRLARAGGRCSPGLQAPAEGVLSTPEVGYTEAARRSAVVWELIWKRLDWTCAFEQAEQRLCVLHVHHPNLPLRWGLVTDASPPNRHPWLTHFN